MPDTVHIKITSSRLLQNISLFAGESLRIEIDDRPADADLIMTIGRDTRVAALIQRAGTDLFEFSVDDLSILPEGATCVFNIWRMDGDAPVLVKRGGLLLRSSLAPADQEGAPVMLRAPVISGVYEVGQTLTIDPGGWQDSDQITQVWQRDGTDIPGADGLQYDIDPLDAGRTLGVRMTIQNDVGVITRQVPGGAVAAAPEPQVPVNTSAPLLSALTATVGDVLSVTTGVWDPVATSLLYQWQADGDDIAGAVQSDLAVTSAMIGARLSVRVTAANSAGAAVPVVTDQTQPVVDFVAPPTPVNHIVLFAGESNLLGAADVPGYDPLIDSDDPRILLFDDNNTLAQAMYPLLPGDAGPLYQVGLAMPYAQLLLQDIAAQDRVVIVQVGEAGSGFQGTKWAAGGSLRQSSIARMNAAIAAVTALGHDHTLQAVWQQGETDAQLGATQAAHAASLDNLISDWRAGITGGDAMPVTLGEMPRSLQGSLAQAAGVVQAIADTPNRVPHSAHVPSVWSLQSGQTGTLPGNPAFTTAASRDMGANHARALPAARANALTRTPENLTAPAIAGVLGVGETLTVSQGTWTQFAASIAYQWTRDAVPVTGANANSYTLQAADEGGVIGCLVTAGNVMGSTSLAATGGGVLTTVSYPAGIADIGNGVWYDLKTPAGYTLDSAEITQVADHSGNSRHLMPIDAGNRPDIAVLNGHTAMNIFDTLEAVNAAPVFSGVAWSLTFLGQLLDNAIGGFLLMLEDSAANKLVQLGHRNSGEMRIMGDAASNSLMTASVTTVSAVTFDYDGSTVRIYIDGVLTSPTAAQSFSNLALDGVFVGGNSIGATSSKINYLIGEMIMIPRGLTPQEIADLHGYLSARWAPV